MDAEEIECFRVRLLAKQFQRQQKSCVKKHKKLKQAYLKTKRSAEINLTKLFPRAFATINKVLRLIKTIVG